MQKSEFVLEIESISKQEDILLAYREAKELKIKFEDFNLEEERKVQVAEIEARERGEEIDTKEEEGRKEDPVKDQFYEFYGDIREKHKAVVDNMRAQEVVALTTKRGLLNALRDLIQNEENVGAAFTRKNEINEQWKAAGDVNRDKRQEVQAEYNTLNEAFFGNIKIYKMLQENDLRVNQKNKLDIIQKVQELANVESIKEIEAKIKNLQNQWSETGPTFNEQWPQIKDAYWENCKVVYARIHDFYEGKRSELKENIDKKKVLLEEVKVITNAPCVNLKEWEDQTKLVIAKQEEWKTIGFGLKEENEQLWQELRTECNLFFDKKKEFFNGLRAEGDEVANKKKALIEQVAQLRESQDWKASSEKIIQLQKDWKNTGNAGRNNEQKLWQEFRSHCDAFFNAKQRHFEEQDKANEVNLIAKQDIIRSIETYVPAEDKKTLLQDLRDFTAAFNAVGKVPMKEKDVIYNAYKTAIDSHYSKMKLEGDEKDKVLFQARMDTFKASPNASKLIDKEKYDIQQQINILKQDIIQYENNMGFFSKSKGASEMLKEVENKIAASKRKMEDLKKKLTAITKEAQA
jgi:Domain of Unknown Function (DUF349)